MGNLKKLNSKILNLKVSKKTFGNFFIYSSEFLDKDFQVYS